MSSAGKQIPSECVCVQICPRSNHWKHYPQQPQLGNTFPQRSVIDVSNTKDQIPAPKSLPVPHEVHRIRIVYTGYSLAVSVDFANIRIMYVWNPWHYNLYPIWNRRLRAVLDFSIHWHSYSACSVVGHTRNLYRLSEKIQNGDTWNRNYWNYTTYLWKFGYRSLAGILRWYIKLYIYQLHNL